MTTTMMMMIATASLVFAMADGATVSMSNDLELQFQAFMLKYNKTYATSEVEVAKRFGIYADNMNKISAHNVKLDSTWKMAENEFADMTWEEFRQGRLGYGVPIFDSRSALPSLIRRTVDFSSLMTVPDKVDWTEAGAVTEIKDQGQCGSCWAFSTTGSIEGAQFIKSRKLVSLSEQELVDCSRKDGNMGCNGGLMDYGFRFAESDGLCLESSYPYDAKTGRCHEKKCSESVRVKSYVDVESGNEDALQAAVALNPVSVAIEADQDGFQFYSSGVFSGECGTNLDHGVLVVGYGTEGAKKFWKVKNSWGPSWGDKGYIYLERTGGKTPGQCGIAMQPSYPIVN